MGFKGSFIKATPNIKVVHFSLAFFYIGFVLFVLFSSVQFWWGQCGCGKALQLGRLLSSCVNLHRSGVEGLG